MTPIMNKRMLLTAGIMMIAGALMAFGGGQSAAVAANYVDLFTKAFKINSQQADSIRAIVSAFNKYGDGDARKLAYILALAYHESRLKPIREIRAKEYSEVWYIQNAYWSTGYYGRGFVQITWKGNYAKMSKIVGIDLVQNPDRALEPNVAAKIMVVGMMEGLFTGKRLGNYINTERADYYNARRTVGAIMVAGDDTAQRIVNHMAKLANQ
jgi:putative chitinase